MFGYKVGWLEPDGQESRVHRVVDAAARSTVCGLTTQGREVRRVTIRNQVHRRTVVRLCRRCFDGLTNQGRQPGVIPWHPRAVAASKTSR